MKIIVHTDDLSDMILAMRAVKSSIEKGYTDCVFGCGATTVYARQNKSSWTAWVTTEARLSEASQ